MTHAELNQVIHRLQRDTLNRLDDGDLLTRFLTHRDDAAFAELVARHGPKVYAIGRRLLGQHQLAEEAFQATFIVLAKKAHAIQPRSAVGGFLYGVARKTALAAYAVNRRPKEILVDKLPETAVLPPDTVEADVLAILDEEIANLSEKLRAVVVLCELDGVSRAVAAKQLRIAEGTLSSRLAAARKQLALRLKKRGVALSAGWLAALAASTSAAALPLLQPSTAVTTAIAKEVLKAMLLTKLKGVTLGVALLVLLGLQIHSAQGKTFGRADRVQRQAPDAEIATLTRNAPQRKEKPLEWHEAKPIELDSGRITSVTYSPSGKTLALCRADGKIDFFDATTRKHLTTMDVAGDKGTTAATYTTLVFRPVPHPTLGDIFAVTHKNGVKFGTVGLGIFTDDAAQVEGIPRNRKEKDVDVHRMAWHVAKDGTDWFAVTDGVGTGLHKLPDVRVELGTKARAGLAVQKHQPLPFGFLPSERFLCLATDGALKEQPSAPLLVALVDSKKTNWLKGHKGRPTCGAEANDGQRLVTGDDKGTLIVWDGESLKEQRRIELGEGVVQLALAPDGKTIAVVRVYSDTTLFGTSGRKLTNFELHVFDVTNPPATPKPLWLARNVLGDRYADGPISLAFSPDGKTLLAAFADPYYTDKDAKSMGVRVWTLHNPRPNPD